MSHSRVGWGVGLLILASVIVIGAIALVPRSEPETRGGPLFVLPAVSKTEPEVKLSDYKGKPVVLNFFASWCVPCRKEMPLLERKHLENKAKVAFVGIDHRDSRTHASDLLKE